MARHKVFILFVSGVKFAGIQAPGHVSPGKSSFMSLSAT